MSNSGQEHPGYQGNWGNQTPCLCHKQTLDSVSSLSPSELPKGGGWHGTQSATGHTSNNVLQPNSVNQADDGEGQDPDGAHVTGGHRTSLGSHLELVGGALPRLGP